MGLSNKSEKQHCSVSYLAMCAILTWSQEYLIKIIESHDLSNINREMRWSGFKLIQDSSDGSI